MSAFLDTKCLINHIYFENVCVCVCLRVGWERWRLILIKSFKKKHIFHVVSSFTLLSMFFYQRFFSKTVENRSSIKYHQNHEIVQSLGPNKSKMQKIQIIGMLERSNTRLFQRWYLISQRMFEVTRQHDGKIII